MALKKLDSEALARKKNRLNAEDDDERDAPVPMEAYVLYLYFIHKVNVRKFSKKLIFVYDFKLILRMAQIDDAKSIYYTLKYSQLILNILKLINAILTGLSHKLTIWGSGFFPLKLARVGDKEEENILNYLPSSIRRFDCFLLFSSTLLLIICILDYG